MEKEAKKEELRDRAALAVIGSLQADGDQSWTKLAEEAYEIADAFLAARKLPSQYEKFADVYRREAAQREKDAVETETRHKALEPLYSWAKEHMNDCQSCSVFLGFTMNHQIVEGEDIVGEFKKWLKSKHPDLARYCERKRIFV